MPSQSASPGEITILLEQWSSGDERALHALTSLVYGRLQVLAKCLLSSERPGHILQPTALVNQAYMRLAADGERVCENRNHFFAVAAHVMRRILVDYARQQRPQKR